MTRKTLASVLLTSAAIGALTGCGLTPSAVTAPASTPLAGIRGSVFGGRQAVVHANVQIYQAGTSGYGTGATGLIASAVITDANGLFNITGDYTCTNGTQLYLAAVGGQPTTGVTNPRVVLLAGLGLCETARVGLQVNINEVTTVATVWSLAAFMNPALSTGVTVNEIGAVDANGINIGAPGSNAAGLAAAFADINTLTDISTGNAKGLNLPATTTVPVDEINALADILAGCVDGDGTQTGCSKLFTYATPATGAIPADTYTSAVDIARNPSNNAAGLLTLAKPVAPYPTALATVNDWTIGVTYTGNGLSSPSAVAVDASGNVWATNAVTNSVSEYSHAGVLLSGTGYTATSLTQPSGIAIDASGNAWVTSYTTPFLLTELSATGSVASGTGYTGGGLNQPTSITFDGTGNAWIANAGNNSVSEFDHAGAAQSGTSGFTATGASAPVGVAVNPR